MRLKLILISMIAFGGALSLSACNQTQWGNTNKNSQASAKTTGPLRILQQITGHDLGLRHAEVLLINSPQELMASGSRKLRKLDIDFQTQSVILIAIGEKSTGGYWVNITGVQPHDQGAYVQATINQPAKGQTTTQSLTCPFAAVVTNKIQGTLFPEIESVTGQDL